MVNNECEVMAPNIMYSECKSEPLRPEGTWFDSGHVIFHLLMNIVGTTSFHFGNFQDGSSSDGML